MARAIKKISGVLDVKVSYRKKAAFVYTIRSMCDKKGQKMLLDGLKKSKRYSGTIYSMKPISSKDRPKQTAPPRLSAKKRKRPPLLRWRIRRPSFIQMKRLRFKKIKVAQKPIVRPTAKQIVKAKPKQPIIRIPKPTPPTKRAVQPTKRRIPVAPKARQGQPTSQPTLPKP